MKVAIDEGSKRGPKKMAAIVEGPEKKMTGRPSKSSLTINMLTMRDAGFPVKRIKGRDETMIDAEQNLKRRLEATDDRGEMKMSDPSDSSTNRLRVGKRRLTRSGRGELSCLAMRMKMLGK